MDKQVKILLFGRMAEIAGNAEIYLPAVIDSDTLIQNLSALLPDFATQKFSIAVNKKIIRVNTLLHPHDEIALLPPFSGG